MNTEFELEWQKSEDKEFDMNSMSWTSVHGFFSWHVTRL